MRRNLLGPLTSPPTIAAVGFSLSAPSLCSRRERVRSDVHRLNHNVSLSGARQFSLFFSWVDKLVPRQETGIVPVQDRFGLRMGPLRKCDFSVVCRSLSIRRDREQIGEDPRPVAAEYLNHLPVILVIQDKPICSSRQSDPWELNRLAEYHLCLLVPFVRSGGRR